MTTSELLSLSDELIAKAIEHCESELAGLQVGRASPGLVENIQVEIYGTKQPIKNAANISVPEPRTLFVEPWDKSSLTAVEKAIRESPLSLNPNNDGARIILNIPPLTEEKRTELTKLVGQIAENGKISIRRAREDLRHKAKNSVSADEITEDEEKVFDKKLQEKIDEANQKIDEAAKQKEQDVMTV